MKKAVIASGGKQYIVREGDVIDIELTDNEKTVEFTPLLVIEDNDVQIGKPFIDGVKVKAEIIEHEVKAEKVVSIRYKAKKRVNKIKGHRQLHTKIKISKIS